MYTQATTTQLGSKFVSGLVLEEDCCINKIHCNQFNGCLTILGISKINKCEYHVGNETKIQQIDKNKIKNMNAQSNKKRRIWQFRVCQVNSKTVQYYRLPEQMSHLQILQYTAIFETTYVFWIKQVHKQQQKQAKQTKKYQQTLYFLQLPKTNIQKCKPASVDQLAQLKYLDKININEGQIYRNDDRNSAPVQIQQYKTKTYSIKVVSIGSQNCCPNYIRLVEQYSMKQTQILPIDRPNLVNLRNPKLKTKTSKIVRVNYVGFEISDIDKNLVSIGQAYCYYCALITSSCYALVIDPTMLTHKSKINIDKQAMNKQKQKLNRYKPIIIVYIQLPSFPSHLLQIRNDQHIPLFIYTMGYQYLMWPNMQSAYKVVVDGYRLGLGTKLDIGLVEENMGQLQVRQQILNVEQEMEQEQEQHQQQQQKPDINEIVTCIYEEKQKPVPKLAHQDSTQYLYKKVSGSTKNFKGVSAQLMQQKQIEKQDSRTDQGKQIHLVIQTVHNNKCRLLRVLLNIQQQVSAYTIKRCVFTKKNPFDVFLRSQYINGYYILNVCENINVCVHNFMDDFDSLELKQENEINENNIVIQVSQNHQRHDLVNKWDVVDLRQQQRFIQNYISKKNDGECVYNSKNFYIHSYADLSSQFYQNSVTKYIEQKSKLVPMQQKKVEVNKQRNQEQQLGQMDDESESNIKQFPIQNRAKGWKQEQKHQTKRQKQRQEQRRQHLNCGRYGKRINIQKNMVYVYALDKSVKNASRLDLNSRYRYITKMEIDSKQVSVFSDVADRIRIVSVCRTNSKKIGSQNKSQIQQRMKADDKPKMSRRVNVIQLCSKKMLYIKMLQAIYPQQGTGEHRDNNSMFVESIAKYMLDLL